jgi:glycosyltransferase involved in cell wall biosynthesis
VTKPIVSILTTVYNREKYLADCIESVLASTYEDWEMIIVDDQSTDRSLEIAKVYAVKDQRIKAFKNTKNLGQFENRNYIASLAQGTFLKYLDSDDVLYPHGLEVFINAAKRYPEAALIISHDQLHENEPYPIYMSPHEAWRSFFLTRGFPATGPSGTLIKRNVFEELNGFPKPYYVGSDILLLLNIARCYPIVKVQPALNWYRTHEGQALTIGMSSNEYLKKDFNYLCNYLVQEDNPLSLEERTKSLQRLKSRQIRGLLRYCFKTGAVLETIGIMKYNKLKPSDLKYLFI